jgi:4-amino-4-deoxy-L-arabinose transferase-like glycosyltransferase
VERERRRDWTLLLIVAGGLVARLLLVWLEPPNRPLGDEPAWLAVADAVQAGGFQPLRADLLFYPPAYPYVIAAARHLCGTLLAVKLLQALLGALLVAVVASVGTLAFGRGVGRLAAALTAFWPVLVWYTAHFWSEPLFVLLLWAGIERVMKGDRDGRLGATSLGGLLLGLAALTREPALYFLPLLAVWVASGRLAWSRRQAWTLVAATLIVVAPWTVRNALRYRAFVPVSTMGSRALWEGNTEGTRGEVYGEYDAVGAREGPIAQHRLAMREGLRAILERQPGWLAEKVASEVPHLLSPDNMVLVSLRRRAYGPVTPLALWLVAAVTILPYLAVMSLFVVGLARLVPSRPAVLLLAFLAFYMLLHVVVHGHHRFRLPMLPAIFVIGASAVPAAGARLAPLSARRRAAVALLALLLALSLAPGFLGLAAEPSFVHRPR